MYSGLLKVSTFTTAPDLGRRLISTTYTCSEVYLLFIGCDNFVMEDYRFLYLSVWIAFLVFSAGIVTKNWSHFKSETLKYWPYITTKWKLVTFAISVTFVSFAGPYTYDPTWDFVSGFGMSLLTYLTAPWSVGVIYQFIKKQRSLSDFFVAITF